MSGGGPIQPNVLSIPGEHAARRRVEAVFEAIDRLSGADLAGIAITRPDDDRHDALLAGLEARAAERGRMPLVEEARAAVRNGVVVRIASEWPAGTYGFRSRINARPGDTVALLQALEDTVSVAVMEDALDQGIADELAEPGRRLLGFEPLVDSRHAARGERHPAARPSPPPSARTRAWEPSDDDWAVAGMGDRGVDHRTSPPGTRGMRIAFFGVVGVVGAIAGVGWGFASEQLLLGILVAAAVVAVCWTFATWRAPA